MANDPNYTPIATALQPDIPNQMVTGITYAVPLVRGTGSYPAIVTVQNDSGSSAQLTGSEDNTNYHNLGSAVTTATIATIANPTPFLKTDHTVTVSFND